MVHGLSIIFLLEKSNFYSIHELQTYMVSGTWLHCWDFVMTEDSQVY